MLAIKLFLLIFISIALHEQCPDNSTSEIDSSFSDLNDNSIYEFEEDESCETEEDEACQAVLEQFPSHNFEKRVHIQKTGKKKGEIKVFVTLVQPPYSF